MGIQGERRGLSVLVVDGDPLMKARVRRLLERHHYGVRLASGAEEALGLIRRSPPALVVTDLQIDEGGGDRLLQEVERSFPAILRVVFSAKPAFQRDALVRAGHAHAALDRSGELHDLVALIHGLITESQLRTWTC